MKSKYDRQALKLEFFQSDIDEVFNFLAGKFGEKTVKWNLKNKVKGWSKEKQEYKNKILQKALERRAKEEANSLEIPIDQLMKAKKAVISLFMNKLNKVLNQQKKDEDADFNVKEFEKILKVIKTELGEPTNISKTDATIKTEPIDESLLIQN